MLLAYQYNEFEIKKHQHSDSYFTIYKDEHIYSSIACRTVKVAKKILDRAFPENRYAEVIPILQRSEEIKDNIVLLNCACGCGETFTKERSKKIFIKGHNNKDHYKKVKNIWNKKIN